MKNAQKERSKERSRAEAAGRRLERARSRRNDGSLLKHGNCTSELMYTTDAELGEDGSPDPPSNRASPPPASSQPPSPPPAEKVSHKKGMGKKHIKKLGNNQYTKRNLEMAASSPFGRKRHLQTQVTTGSGDEASEPINKEVNGNSKASPGVIDNGHTNGTAKPKFGRKKNHLVNGTGVNKTVSDEIPRTFGNMSLALTNMNAFVLRQQAELAPFSISEATSPPDDNLSTVDGHGAAVSTSGDMNTEQAVEAIEVPPAEEFSKLSAAEMAALLTKNIAKWQKMYGPLSQPVIPPS